MKTLNYKEIKIDLTGSDSRSGATTLAKILMKLFKKNGVQCEFEFKKKIDKPDIAKKLYGKDAVEKINLDEEKNLDNLLLYYKDCNVFITIIPE